MTGRYPMRTGGQHGVLGNMDETWIPEGESMLPERLTELGYSCKISGKWHLGSGSFKYIPTARGFNEFYGPYAGGADHWEHIAWAGGGPHRDSNRRSQHNTGAVFGLTRPFVNMVDNHWDRWSPDGTEHTHEHVYSGDNYTHSSDAFAREAVRMIYEHDPDLGPLFMFVAFTAPHWPTQFWQHHADANSHIPGIKRREFAAMITHIDECVRRIVEALKRKRMWDNTLLIASSDNGGDVITGASNHPFRGTKTTPWEGGTRAAAFVHSPNPEIIPESRRGSESFTLAHITDWYPTLIGLAGGSIHNHHNLDGFDIWSALVSGDAGATDGPRTEILYQMDYEWNDLTARASAKNSFFFPGPHAAIRIGDWKLIEGYPGRSGLVRRRSIRCMASATHSWPRCD